MLAEGGVFNGKAEPQHLEAAIKVAKHRRTEAATEAAAPPEQAGSVHTGSLPLRV